jgi:hypothetical protein
MKQINVHRRMGMTKGPDPVDGIGVAIGAVIFILFLIWAAA